MLQQTIGALLREKRLALGIDLEQVAQTVKIRPRYLSAIEDDQYDIAPSPVYLANYIRSYAEYLGFDAREIIEQFRQQCLAVEDQSLANADFVPVVEDVRPNKMMLWASAVLSLFLCLVWYFMHTAMPHITHHYSSSFFTSENTAEPLESTIPALDVQDILTKTIGHSGSFVPDLQMDRARLVLLAKDQTWVKVLDRNSELIAETVMQAGDTYFVPHEKGLIFLAGHPESLEVFVDGSIDHPDAVIPHNLSESGKLISSRRVEFMTVQ
jgi:cytoskeletal protein RodZ